MIRGLTSTQILVPLISSLTEKSASLSHWVMVTHMPTGLKASVHFVPVSDHAL